MIFNQHFGLAGRHAFLSASKYHWVNYDEDKFDRVFMASLASQRGTELHELAQRLIKLKVKLEENEKTLNKYVNDAIGFRMSPEQPLYVSDNCFGHPDAIGFRVNVLRIHDLKTGVSPTSPLQLEIYAGMFCIEYEVNPFEIEVELRIYQSDEVRVYRPTPDRIIHVKDRIKTFDRRINEMKREVQ